MSRINSLEKPSKLPFQAEKADMAVKAAIKAESWGAI